MRYLVCIALPARLARPIAAVTQLHPGHSPSVPHITLVGPRTIEAADREAELVRALRATIRTFTPAPIAYCRAAYFGRRTYIYLVVPPTSWLAFWHKACAHAVKRILRPSLYSWLRFHPHITVAAGLSGEEGAAVWRAARAIRGAFQCRQILLMRQNDLGEPWQRVARFRLAGKSPGGAASPRTLAPVRRLPGDRGHGPGGR